MRLSFYNFPFSVLLIKEHIENLEMPGVYKVGKLALGAFNLEDDLSGTIEIHQWKSALWTSYCPERLILCSFSGLFAIDHFLLISIILHPSTPYA